MLIICKNNNSYIFHQSEIKAMAWFIFGMILGSFVALQKKMGPVYNWVRGGNESKIPIQNFYGKVAVIFM